MTLSRWRLDMTTPLENQCWVFSTHCCCLGWNSLIFSSSDIPPTATSRTGWQNQRDGRDGAYSNIFTLFFSLQTLFCSGLTSSNLICFRMLYKEIDTAAIEVLWVLEIKRTIAITQLHQGQKNTVSGFNYCWDMVWGEEGQGRKGLAALGKALSLLVSDPCWSQELWPCPGTEQHHLAAGRIFLHRSCLSRHCWVPPSALTVSVWESIAIVCLCTAPNFCVV